MWAHYADNFHGVCIGYWTSGVFSEAQKLEYVSNHKRSEAVNAYGFVNGDSVENEVLKSFFYKHIDWAYEKEYRIVKKTKEQFFKYKHEDIACVILGANIEKSICTFLAKSIPQNTCMFKAKIGYRSFGIDLYSFENKITYDGSIMDYIRDDSQLINVLETQKTSLLYC